MKTSALQPMAAASDDNGRMTKDIALIKDVPINIQARLGTATLTVEKLFSLRGGEVVELDQGLDDAVTFYMDDKPIARGHLVAVDDHYGIEISEIL